MEKGAKTEMTTSTSIQSPNNFAINFRATPLMLASGVGAIDLVDALLKGGASPNDKGSAGLYPQSALSTGLLLGSATEVTVMLANAGVRLDEEFGFPYWTWGYYPESMQKGTPLMLATTKEMVESLIQLGAKVASQNSGGETAVTFHSFLQTDLNIVGSLVASGADINHVNFHGDTALSQAAGYLSEAKVDFFLRLGADPNIPRVSTGDGQAPPIFKALRFDEYEPSLGNQVRAARITERLLNGGAHTDLVDSEARTVSVWTAKLTFSSETTEIEVAMLNAIFALTEKPSINIYSETFNPLTTTFGMKAAHR